ncbi:zinc-ribbon domain-containing protein [Clostridium sp.]|nr:zinc-ribbon domain-containing protein [Clostridium sp.]
MVEKNKIKPTEVSIGSHKKVIWRCEKGTRMGSCR